MYNKHKQNVSNIKEMKFLIKVYWNITNKEEAKLFLKNITFQIFMETLKNFNFYENNLNIEFYLKQYNKIINKCDQILKK